MTVLAPECSSADGQLELLIREARRRQRRRQLATVLTLTLAAGGVYLGSRMASSPARAGLLLSRPLHFPAVAFGGRCPTTSGYVVNNPYFAGDAIGRGPVRLLLAQQGDVVHGRAEIVGGATGRWRARQTLWFAMPGYAGPFVVRATRLDARAPIEVQPDGTGLAPGSGPLLVPSGPTANTQYGYRTVPGSTWVKSPGCYAWQVDGRGFSDVLVVEVVSAGR